MFNELEIRVHIDILHVHTATFIDTCDSSSTPYEFACVPFVPFLSLALFHMRMYAMHIYHTGCQAQILQMAKPSKKGDTNGEGVINSKYISTKAWETYIHIEVICVTVHHSSDTVCTYMCVSCNK